MGNPLKGAVTFTGTDGQAIQLSFSAEALYRLEQQLDKRINVISTEMQNPELFNLGTIRTLFWAALLDTHEDLKLEDVGKFFRQVPPLEAIAHVTAAFNGAFAGAEKSGEAGAGSVPLAAGQDQTGTGSPS